MDGGVILATTSSFPVWINTTAAATARLEQL
jgi:hypothetical protein